MKQFKGGKQGVLNGKFSALLLSGRVLAVFLCLITAYVPRVEAVPFGILDPRAMGMGGTGVATATSASAHYYNPALFAIYNQYKEKGGESRILSPAASVVVGDIVDDVDRVSDRDYSQELTTGINAFNRDPSQQNAATLADLTNDIKNDLEKVADELFSFDVHLALTTGIASKRQGGAFFLQSRAVGSAILDLSDHDSELLDGYISSMTFLATGGEEGELVPELFDDNGQLLDFTDTLSSEGFARGAFISESGVAVADETTLLGQTFFWGLTPKIQVISAFDYIENVAENDLNLRRDLKRSFGLNLDLGMAKNYKNNYRFGVVIKDLWPRDVTTELGNDIELRPQIRAGAAYKKDKLLVAVDMDLWPNDPIGIEDKTMYYATGVEYQVYPTFLLRGGYRHDFMEFTDLGLVTGGFGWLSNWGFVDLSLGRSADDKALAAQLGFRF